MEVKRLEVGLNREIRDVQTPRPLKARTGTGSCGNAGKQKSRSKSGKEISVRLGTS